MPVKWLCPDPDDLCRRYEAGESEKALAEVFGVSRTAIRRRLVERNIAIRNRSAAMFTRMAQMSPDERLRLASAAHDAVRGSKQAPEVRLKGAATNEKRRSHVSRAHEMLEGMLLGMGYEATVEKAIGPYNVDIASSTIAVEILGGGWHATKLHGKRLRYLLDGGWDVFYIWVDAKHYPLEVGAAEYVAAQVEFRKSHPAGRRRYGVIRGSGEEITIVEFDGDNVPDVIPISRRTYPESVPFGFCHCGCGQRTPVSRQTRRGHLKGEPLSYISGHNNPSRAN